MIDNLKTGVLHHPPGGPVQFNPRYLDLAAHYGFQPVACAVRRGNQKGRAESAVGSVKKNRLRGLDIPSWAALAPAAHLWLQETANVRIHGETHRKPIDLFAEEKSDLHPLPVVPYDSSVIKPVSVTNRCRIHFDGNRYSIPYLYASQKLTAKIYPDRLVIYAACLEDYSVIFANAMSLINELSAAQTQGRLQSELKKYLRPQLLILDEVGYLPIDQRGADLLFQVISQRYERGSIVLTTNKAFKQWASIFNHDSALTSAVLDRLLHHAETVVIEGTTYRMKDQLEPPAAP